MNFLEEMIQEAQNRGDFDNLKGQGKPLKIDDSPFTGETRLAYSMVKEAGFTLAFIADRNNLTARIDAQRTALRTAAAYLPGTPWNLVHWNHAVELFREEAAAINRAILTYNLKAPHPRFHLLPLEIDREIDAFHP